MSWSEVLGVAIVVATAILWVRALYLAEARDHLALERALRGLERLERRLGQSEALLLVGRTLMLGVPHERGLPANVGAWCDDVEAYLVGGGER